MERRRLAVSLIQPTWMIGRERRQWARQAGSKGRNRVESLSEEWERKVESGRGKKV